MAPPKANNLTTIPARFTKPTVDKMDALIKTGHFASRSDLIKNAVENLLNENRVRDEADRMIQLAIASGKYDTLIEERLKVAFGRLMASASDGIQN
jgi:Arc/MetJ-type ribon-helix-helix transcriptional regulator